MTACRPHLRPGRDVADAAAPRRESKGRPPGKAGSGQSVGLTPDRDVVSFLAEHSGKPAFANATAAGAALCHALRARSLPVTLPRAWHDGIELSCGMRGLNVRLELSPEDQLGEWCLVIHPPPWWRGVVTPRWRRRREALCCVIDEILKEEWRVARLDWTSIRALERQRDAKPSR